MSAQTPSRAGRREAERFLLLSQELTRLNQQVDRWVLASAELSPAQAAGLEELWRHGALPMGELARRLYITAGSATRLVKALQRRGILRRRTVRGDARQSHVELSAKGEELYGTMREESLRTRREILSSSQLRGQAASLLDGLQALLEAQADWADRRMGEDSTDGEENWLT